jgi:hypothetical protein
MRLRKDGQPDRRFGAHPPGKHCEPYTAESHARWLARNQPNPKHVRTLREGIALFRDMLEAKGPQDEYSPT